MKILAVTACPTGIAHTYMAAEALQMAAEGRGIEIKVETRGAVGAENEITPEDMQDAHAVIIAADTQVDKGRFNGLPILEVMVKEAISNPNGLIDQALQLGKGSYIEAIMDARKTGKLQQPTAYRHLMTGDSYSFLKKLLQQPTVYKHLMTGVSFMLPLVAGGGLLIALSFAFGIEAFKQQGTFAAALMDIGGGSAFALMLPVLAGYIAFSIADRPGLAPGLVGGMLASKIGAGFLGAMIGGFLAGYIALWLKQNIKLPRAFDGLKPVLIIPFISITIVGLAMIYLIGTPIKTLMDWLTATLTGMSSVNAVLMGAILGAMMAFDMGGPVNKVAYTFAVGLLSSNIYAPMAAVMAAGMTPPLGLGLVTFLDKEKFTLEERSAGKTALALGISFITEGAIPFAAADPIRVIPSIVVGSAVTGALSMAFGCSLRVPHGGIFVLPLSNAVENLSLYIAAIAIGTVVTALLVDMLKPSVTK